MGNGLEVHVGSARLTDGVAGELDGAREADTDPKKGAATRRFVLTFRCAVPLTHGGPACCLCLPGTCDAIRMQ